MRLDDFDPSDNVRDLGSSSGPGGGFGGGGGGNILLGLLPLLLGRKMGCGTLAILAIGAVLFFSMGGGGGLIAPQSGVQAPAGTGTGGGATGAAACNTPERRFSCQVLASTEQTWERIFAESGQRYPAPTLNFYQGGATSGCGFASSAVGPYYCPADQGVFLDTSFFDELANRFGAAGDFAQAYVIAHEVGHHIQTVTGTSERVRREQSRVGEREGNQLSVRMELQADCYAGVWANRNKQYLEAGDIEEGLRAAEAIGDDTLQRQAQGRVVPDSFTHGSSAQRQKWLRIGLDSGNPAACDTFSQPI
ncbi:zinc metallopeptidase [Sphingomonas sp. BGYR3]|uniref:KPN_02809 family neutral zinc metallopeptidase n=1 Tax=Sphingomonas sp. BGYR3 TaxID=2975483 RepID=UPI0021A4D331|nr:neutral zinc metallopeptidase [Sphingomonas sp. BGYR3]MDG5489387.1 zinc metallopeptidase [Sphingomonas sp. BGYR3]